MSDEYHMRGNRVDPLTPTAVKYAAFKASEKFNLKMRRKKKIDQSFELLTTFGVCLNPIPDEECLGLTSGHYDPSSRTITVPETIYLNACDGERDALFVMLHELGHMVLGHQALLHSSNVRPTIYEDAEWQADCFAEEILKIMGYEVKQMSFDFYL